MGDDLDIVLSTGATSGGTPDGAARPRLDLTIDEAEDRYSRLRLIPWWEHARLSDARVMVVGAGAIGNEVLKNLALLGVGSIFLVDLDRVENSNLSRSVLFRREDEGRPKAQAAAERLRELNPDVHVSPLVGNVVHDVGLGVYRQMDVVIGGLDNREARLAINQACWKVNVPWIDGAIEVLHGVARVFVPPDSACYECTMNDMDYRLLSVRRSCALLSRDQLLERKVPTTPTTASVIAGVQVQEAVKILHGRSDLPCLRGQGFVFNGLSHDSYRVDYDRREDCLSHDTYANIRETGKRADSVSAGDMLALARAELGNDAVIEFEHEIVTALSCSACSRSDPLFRALGAVTEAEARCPACGTTRTPEMTHAVTGDESFAQMTLADLGIPPRDVVTGRSGLERVHFELSGDRCG